MGALSIASNLGRLTGEDERFDDVASFFFGVLTSTVLITSLPRRVFDSTSFRNCTLPRCLIVFGLDENDIMGELRDY
jgi:hypothetical protein